MNFYSANKIIPVIINEAIYNKPESATILETQNGNTYKVIKSDNQIIIKNRIRSFNEMFYNAFL